MVLLAGHHSAFYAFRRVSSCDRSSRELPAGIYRLGGDVVDPVAAAYLVSANS